jgi:hypothetical protein
LTHILTTCHISAAESTLARPAGRHIAVALFACALAGCAARKYDHDMLQHAQARLLARAGDSPCPLENAQFQGEENLMTGMPFRLVLSCRSGKRETFVLSHPRSIPSDSGPRFVSISAEDGAAELDLAPVSALMDRVFADDPWVEPVVTFNPGNAVGLPYELTIIAFIVAAFGAGLVLVLVSRPASHSP